MYVWQGCVIFYFLFYFFGSPLTIFLGNTLLYLFFYQPGQGQRNTATTAGQSTTECHKRDRELIDGTVLLEPVSVVFMAEIAIVHASQGCGCAHTTYFNFSM